MIGAIPAARDGNHPRPGGLRQLDGHAAHRPVAALISTLSPACTRPMSWMPT